MKRNGQKKEKEKKSAHNRQSITSAWNTTGGDLQPDLENEGGIEPDKPLEASNPDQSKSTKTSLLTQLVVVGKYLTSASIYEFITIISREKSGAADSAPCLHHVLWCGCKFLL